METPPVLAIDKMDAIKLLSPLLTPGEAVGLAVSGGADSMALALCAKAAGVACRAFIVDHDLRPESGEEAALVKQRLEQWGIEAEILRWTHGEIPSRIHVEARKARYALLVEACRRHGLKTLLLAHHRDDQAETILMRLAKGSGVEGLAGMAAVTLFDGIRLVRPFLNLPKAQLVSWCEAQGLPYVTDPSNAKVKYARGRLRRVWDALAQEGLTAQRLVDLGARAGEAAQAVTFYAETFLKDHARLVPGGAIRIDLAPWRDAPRAVGLKALALCLLAVRPVPFAPERKALVGLYAFLASMPQGAGRSLNGCLIRTDGAGQTATILRDVAAIVDVQPIGPGDAVLWDGRWRVALEAQAAAGGEIRPLGFQPKGTLDRLAPGLRKRIPQGRIRAALPALYREGQWIALPKAALVLPLPLRVLEEDRSA